MVTHACGLPSVGRRGEELRLNLGVSESPRRNRYRLPRRPIIPLCQCDSHQDHSYRLHVVNRPLSMMNSVEYYTITAGMIMQIKAEHSTLSIAGTVSTAVSAEVV